MESARMKSVVIYLFIIMAGLSVCVFPVYSQVTEDNNIQQSSMPDEINYREKIFLHIDHKLYLSGEIIWFKGYCTHRNLNVFSDLSKVMYVEVLNNQNKPVLSEKVLLERGTGHGNITIPRSIQTGIYYIRAYTRWMTNFNPGYFFMDKIYIINPFLPLEITRNTPDESDNYTVQFYAKEGRLEAEQINDITFHAVNPEGNGVNITLHTDKSVYTFRERVSLTIISQNNLGKPLAANMSISVYKSDNKIGLNHKNIFQYLNWSSFIPDFMSVPDDQFPFSEYNTDALNKIIRIISLSADSVNTGLDVPSDHTYILPETRGLTVTGTVYNVLTDNPSSGIKIYVAQPGKTAQIYTTRSGGYGRFQVRLFDQYGRNDIIAMPAENPDNYYIILDDDFSSNYYNINPQVYRPDDQTVEYIEKLMVNLQIEDAFGNHQLSGGDLKQYDLSNIYGEPDESVLLEDYIKLPAIEELFFELVKSVLIKRKRNNNFELQIIDPASRLAIPGQPLFLLDGVPVLDINPVIIYMDPVDIEKIDVVTTRFIQGNEAYHGIINMITKQADFHHFDLPSYAIRKPYRFFQVPGTFHSPDYSSYSDSLRSHPDYRNLLYWNPEIITDNKGTVTVSFFTADDISDYRIVIQGLSEDGLPGYCETMISVK